MLTFTISTIDWFGLSVTRSGKKCAAGAINYRNVSLYLKEMILNHFLNKLLKKKTDSK